MWKGVLEPHQAEHHVRRCYGRTRETSLFSPWCALSAVREIDGDKERDLICQLKLFNYLLHLLTITHEETQGILQGFPWRADERAALHSHNHCHPRCSCAQECPSLAEEGNTFRNDSMLQAGVVAPFASGWDAGDSAGASSVLLMEQEAQAWL